MVVGNGLMAKTFSDYKDNENIVVFASGVSNSNEKNKKAFEREFNLLKETIVKYSKARLIYFSTCSIEDDTVKERAYVKHKLKLEAYIKKECIDFLIFRVSNVVGQKGNANTIMNYLVHAIQNEEEITLWKNAERNIIDAEDVKLIVDDVLLTKATNNVINVATRKSLSIIDIVEQIERYFNVKIKAKYISRGNTLKINTEAISYSLNKIERDKGSGKQYIFNLLNKYY